MAKQKHTILHRWFEEVWNKSSPESPKVSPINSQGTTRAQDEQPIRTSTQLPNNANSQTVNVTTGSKSPVVSESKGDVAITYK